MLEYLQSHAMEYMHTNSYIYFLQKMRGISESHHTAWVADAQIPEACGMPGPQPCHRMRRAMAAICHAEKENKSWLCLSSMQRRKRKLKWLISTHSYYVTRAGSWGSYIPYPYFSAGEVNLFQTEGHIHSWTCQC